MAVGSKIKVINKNKMNKQGEGLQKVNEKSRFVMNSVKEHFNHVYN